MSSREFPLPPARGPTLMQRLRSAFPQRTVPSVRFAGQLLRLLTDVARCSAKEWASAVGTLPTLTRPLRLALPCAGVDGAGHALRAMGIPAEPTHLYDLREHLRPALLRLYGEGAAGRLHLGSAAGNILELDPSKMAPVDGIIAGPPCPPWSSIGLRQGQDDGRAAVFNHVVEMIIELGRRGALFFILENVPGLLHRTGSASRAQGAGHPAPAQTGSRPAPARTGSRPATARAAAGAEGTEPSFVDYILEEFAARAPVWKIHIWRLNACHFGLPQHRERVFLVGINQHLVPESHLLPPQGLGPPTPLASFLSSALAPQAQLSSLTPNLRWNLVHYQQLLRAHLERGNGWAAVSLDRNPARSFGGYTRVDGLVPALRTQNQYLWVMRLGQGLAPETARLLHPMERWSLQGFPPSAGLGMTKTQVLEATGNAFPVPVLGAVLAQVLRAVADAMSSPRPPRSLRWEPPNQPRRAKRRAPAHLLQPPGPQRRRSRCLD